MDEATLAAIREIAEALKSDLSSSIAALDAKYSEIADSVAAMKKKADEAGERDRGVDGTMAERVAADSVGRSELAALRFEVAALKKARPSTDMNRLADIQSKADAVLRTHNEAADAPMSGEDVVSYNIRMARKMQPHSARWKGVDLHLIKADQQALENVITEIRAEALQAGLSPVGLPEFQHRMITKTTPGGHQITEFVGNGTIFKQMSRPVRHVAYIGVRPGYVT
jgi:hypothetical protein